MSTDAKQHPIDALVPDPSGRPPLADESGFAAILEGMVADYAPRLFAVVHEWGDRVDARIAAWGLSFRDHVDVIGINGAVHLSVPTPDDVLHGFYMGTHITPRLVWVNPEAATATD